MTREKLQALINDFSDNSPLNFIPKKFSDVSQDPDYIANNYAKNNLYKPGAEADMYKNIEVDGVAGMRFYQHPIFSIARADAPGFATIKQPEVVGAHHLMPVDWLPSAKSVISFFLPFERDTVEANKLDPVYPSIKWLYTRVDGQRFLLALGAAVRDALIAEGYDAIAPYTEDRFIMRVGTGPVPDGGDVPPYSSNWSERHVGVASGLGTFGLSTNFISRAGCAGRLISIVTDWETDPDIPDYTDWLGYCNRCGACINKCPAQAHYTDRQGKDHGKCGALIGKVSAEHSPRYGCGKCQSGIPCEYGPMPPKI